MTRRPGPQPDWSVKDVIAHITWWESAMTNWVSRALTGEMLARTETPDEINARVYADNRDMPLETVCWRLFEPASRRWKPCSTG